MGVKAGGLDELTGLLRYDDFVKSFSADIDRVEGPGGGVSMALVDIDGFGALNEAFGRAAGDETLKRLAGFLKEAFREKGMVFRYGGDAFAVLLAGMEKEKAFLTVEQMRSVFNAEGLAIGPSNSESAAGKRRSGPKPVTVSVGVAAYPDDGAQALEIARKASEAIYRAKAGGGNKVCLAREEKMVTKTSHYTQGQLYGLSRLAKRMKTGEAELLREALDDLFRKHNA